MAHRCRRRVRDRRGRRTGRTARREAEGEGIVTGDVVVPQPDGAFAHARGQACAGARRRPRDRRVRVGVIARVQVHIGAPRRDRIDAARRLADDGLVLRVDKVVRIHAGHGLARVLHGVRQLRLRAPLVALHHRVVRQIAVLLQVGPRALGRKAIVLRVDFAFVGEVEGVFGSRRRRDDHSALWITLPWVVVGAKPHDH